MKVISIETVKRINAKFGFHYFSDKSMRFFSSYTSHYAYQIGNKAYFITSEKNTFTVNNPRKYSIRVIDLTSGNINTIGKFQEFNSNAEAQAQLKRILTREEKIQQFHENVEAIKDLETKTQVKALAD